MDKRLQQFLSAENITQAQFADTIGVARASVSHILAGRNKPGFDFIESMSSHYPNISLEWLISGRGRMYKNSALPADCPAPDAIPVQIKTRPASLVQPSSQESPEMTVDSPSATHQGESALPAAEDRQDDLFSNGTTTPEPGIRPAPERTATAARQTAPNQASQPQTAPALQLQPATAATGRRIVRMTVFYDDGTFQDLQ